MRKKHSQLNIPQPCHESWDQMKPVDKGRFCGSCQKQVVDFTAMSDTQLVAFFRKPSTGSVCGRFMQDQLDRSIDIPKKRIPWVKYFFQFALPAFLVSAKASAQGQVRMFTGDTVIVPKSKIGEIGTINAIEIENQIRGKVVDDNGEGVAYASVFIKGTTTGTAADSAGNFLIKYAGVEDSLVLISSCVGFQETHRSIKLNNQPEHVIIEMLYDNTLEEVVIAGLIQIKGRIVAGATSVVKTTNIFDTICNKIFPSKKLLKLYPNPVKGNTALSIEISKQEAGKYLFQLTALSGQVIISKEMWIDENSRVMKIDIPSAAAGPYLLSMTNKKSGKSNTEKVIVE